MSTTNSYKKLNQYHLNLIGDNSCKILKKNGVNFAQKFQNMMSMIAEENSERFENYDEIIASMSPKKLRNLSNFKKSRWNVRLHMLGRSVCKIFKKILLRVLLKLLLNVSYDKKEHSRSLNFVFLISSGFE